MSISVWRILGEIRVIFKIFTMGWKSDIKVWMHSLKWYFYALFSQQNSWGDHSLFNFLCPFYFEHFFCSSGYGGKPYSIFGGLLSKGCLVGDHTNIVECFRWWSLPSTFQVWLPFRFIVRLENYQALLWWIFQMGKFLREIATLTFTATCQAMQDWNL